MIGHGHSLLQISAISEASVLSVTSVGQYQLLHVRYQYELLSHSISKHQLTHWESLLASSGMLVHCCDITAAVASASRSMWFGSYIRSCYSCIGVTARAHQLILVTMEHHGTPLTSFHSSAIAEWHAGFFLSRFIVKARQAHKCSIFPVSTICFWKT